MSVKTVRNIFVIFMIYLPLQYIVVGIVGHYKSEPWPAFVLPGFKNVYVYNHSYQISQTYFGLYNSDNEQIMNLKAYRFFPDIPRSQISGFMSSHFSDAQTIENLSPEAKEWLKDNSNRLAHQHVSYIEVIHSIEYYRRYDNGLRVDSTDHQFTAVIQFEGL